MDAGHSEFERKVFNLLNEGRKNPKTFIPKLNEMKKHFNGNLLSIPGRTGLMTNEGVAAVDEAIAFLGKQKPIAEFKWHDKLAEAARGHAVDLGGKGLQGHDSSDGTSFDVRLKKYVTGLHSTMGENCGYHFELDPYDVVLDLIIDDGVSSRGHRLNIFNEAFISIGVGTAPHKEYTYNTVLDFLGAPL
eukprot:TRINITY_DN8571_c0_g6_i2.p1 TRINITY_DN8571_c0_g6~~TRINITY_DN8571_c0_g6_i2.p1  ORF type:complete len:189 (-),score=35.94 TRINITY_DN8571_c0_g6_i2:61-627(-)